MEEHQAYKRFCDQTSAEPNEADYIAMLREEAESEIEDSKRRRGRRCSWGAALEVAEERILKWFAIATEYNVDDLPRFVASHRRAAVWAVLFGRQHGEYHIMTTEQITTLRRFIAPAQLRTMLDYAANGEEREWYRQRIESLHEAIMHAPRTYEQDGKGDAAVAHFHYFHAADGDWYVTELDSEPVQHQAFGLADLGEPEMGYISIVELIRNGAELDLYWTPKTIGDVRKSLAQVE